MRALPLVSPLFTGIRGEQGPAFLLQLGISTSSSLLSSGVCHGRARGSRTASPVLLGLVRIPTGCSNRRGHDAGNPGEKGMLWEGRTLGSRLGSRTKHRMMAGLHQDFSRWERQRAGGTLISKPCQKKTPAHFPALEPGLGGQGPSPSCAGGR